MSFFLKTLNESRTTLEKKVEDGFFIKKDLRGRHKPANKISENAYKFIFQHIYSFEKLDSHYARSQTDKQYLGSSLNLTEMHRLYCLDHQKWPDKGNEKPVKYYATYRSIFKNLFPKLAFRPPKKDSCKKCSRFATIPDELMTHEMIVEKRNHESSRDAARETKDFDKVFARQSEGTVFCIQFDMQAILESPCCSIMYKKKFHTSNLTIFNTTTKDGYCFL